MPRFFITILIAVGIYYGFKFLFRFAFPLIMKRFMSKMMGGAQNPFNQEPPQVKKEGEVTITKKPKSTKQAGENDADFVDFEEL